MAELAKYIILVRLFLITDVFFADVFACRLLYRTEGMS